MRGDFVFQRVKPMKTAQECVSMGIGPLSGKRVLYTEQVAKTLNCSIEAIWNWTKNKRFPVAEKILGTARVKVSYWYPEQIEEFMKSDVYIEWLSNPRRSCYKLETAERKPISRKKRDFYNPR